MPFKHGSILWICLLATQGPDLVRCPSDPAFSGGHCCISLPLDVSLSTLVFWIERGGAFTKEWLWFQNERDRPTLLLHFETFLSWKSGWEHPLSSLYGSVTCMFVTQCQKSIPLFKHELRHRHLSPSPTSSAYWHGNNSRIHYHF